MSITLTANLTQALNELGSIWFLTGMHLATQAPEPIADEDIEHDCGATIHDAASLLEELEAVRTHLDAAIEAAKLAQTA